MYLIPFIRTNRAIAACTLMPDDPLLAITLSETISYMVPFITNFRLKSFDNMVLFLFYYLNFNETAIEIMDKFKNKYIFYYKLENISILIYLIIYFYNYNNLY